MEKYIQKLIADNTRVIIPDFGAFIRPQGDGEIMFNQFLSFDDGMLVGVVKENENLSEDEAKAKIASFVEGLKNRLGAGETVVLDGVASFSMEGEHINMVKTEDKSPIIDIPHQSVEPKNEAPVAEAPKVEAPEPKPAEPTVTVNNYYPEEKKLTWLYIALIVLLFLVGVYICLFVVNKDNVIYNYFYGTEQVEEEPEPVVVVKPEPKVEEPAPEPVAVAQPLEKRYNIIVGSYNDEASANARVEKLKAKGFDQAFSIRRDINGKTKYLAVIESHDSLPTAERRQEEIVDNYRIESWITNAGE